MKNNEKVADIAREMHDMQFDWAVPCDVRPVFRLYADRLKAANKRETSMKLLATETWIKKANGLRDKLCVAEREIAELRETIESNDRVDKASEKADSDKKMELYGEISRMSAIIGELRECLREAVNNECNYCRTVHKDGTYGKCEHLRENGECDHLRGVKCIVHKWRKVLEGGTK